jgi:hypothetical protein
MVYVVEDYYLEHLSGLNSVWIMAWNSISVLGGWIKYHCGLEVSNTSIALLHMSAVQAGKGPPWHQSDVHTMPTYILCTLAHDVCQYSICIHNAPVIAWYWNMPSQISTAVCPSQHAECRMSTLGSKGIFCTCQQQGGVQEWYSCTSVLFSEVTSVVG